ncbi:MAG: amino acid ABC transporter permease [Granulosicoccus sp.]|nr:amino acid ABC transporter permease [Granulosicoccus sp.]
MKSFLQSIFGDFHGNILFVLLDATQWTIYLSLTAFIGGGLIGLLITSIRILPQKFCKRLAVSYIWLFQAIPLLMLLFLTGLGIPVFFKIDMPPWLAASISLTLFTSAYMAEVWRGAIEAVPAGQWEASRALGLGYWRTVQKIISPQALRIAIPPTVGFMVQIIKGTSLAYIIDFNDLMRWGKKIANAQLDGAEPFIIFPVVAFIYFCLCFPLSLLSRHLEKSMLTNAGMRKLELNQPL